MAAAVIDDVVALFLLAAAHSAVGGEFEAPKLLGIAALAVPLLGGLAWLTGTLVHALAARAEDSRGAIITLAAVAAILCASWLTHVLGYSAVVGGFFAGLGLSTALAPEDRARHAARIAPMVMLLTPFFFVLIGARANFEVIADPGIPTLPPDGQVGARAESSQSNECVATRRGTTAKQRRGGGWDPTPRLDFPPTRNVTKRYSRRHLQDIASARD